MTNRIARGTVERRIISAQEWTSRGYADLGQERRKAVPKGEARRIAGYASVFNQESLDLGGFVEIMAPGAFANALSRSDAAALLNHRDDLILGRQSAKTVRIWEDATGLGFELEAPDTTTGQEVLELVRLGNLIGASFSFTVETDQWKRVDGKDVRTVVEVRELFDVSPCLRPAYPQTHVTALRARRSGYDHTRDPELKQYGHEVSVSAPSRYRAVVSGWRATSNAERERQRKVMLWKLGL